MIYDSEAEAEAAAKDEFQQALETLAEKGIDVSAGVTIKSRMDFIEDGKPGYVTVTKEGGELVANTTWI